MPRNQAVGPSGRESHPRGVRDARRDRRAAGRVGELRSVLHGDLLPPAGDALLAGMAAGRQPPVGRGHARGVSAQPSRTDVEAGLFYLVALGTWVLGVHRPVLAVDAGPVLPDSERCGLRAPHAGLPDRSAVEPIRPHLRRRDLCHRTRHAGRLPRLLEPGFHSRLHALSDQRVRRLPNNEVAEVIGRSSSALMPIIAAIALWRVWHRWRTAGASGRRALLADRHCGAVRRGHSRASSTLATPSVGTRSASSSSTRFSRFRTSSSLPASSSASFAAGWPVAPWLTLRWSSAAASRSVTCGP